MQSSQIPYHSDPFKSDFSLNELLLRIQVNTRANWKDIHKNSGVYVVYHQNPREIGFNSNAGCSSARIVNKEILINKWQRIALAAETDIIYIGRGNVRKRVRALLRFGLGEATNHVGGEWLWQTNGYENLRIMISSCPPQKETAYERYRLDKFRSDHEDWPLANRTGGIGLEIWFPPI